jgi:two-component system, sensor histidine kinase PdtaS
METSSYRLRGLIRHRMAAPTVTFAVFVVAGIITAATAIQNYRSATSAAETQAQAAALVVATHVEWMMEASSQALQRIDDALETQSFRSGQGGVNDITKAVGQLPKGFQYSVYDSDGQLRFSSIQHAVTINVADREYFRQLKDGTSTAISPQLDERLSHQQVFIIGRRIEMDGTFRGVATIAIPAAKMDEFWGAMALGPNSTVSVIRIDGWLLARYPAVPNTLDMRGTQLFQKYAAGERQGVYHSAGSPADGVSRIVGFRKADGWPLLAVAGIERGHSLETFWSALILQLELSVPLTILLLIGTWIIVRLMQGSETRNAELEQALDRNTYLFKEIHHRVKNNLQAVSSLIRLQPIPNEIKADIDRRLGAMVALHEQIYKNDQFDVVALAPYITKLVADLSTSYGKPVDIDLQIDPVTVARDQALPLGMIINEVVSNAYKYAFQDREDGRLKLRVKVDGELLRIEIADNGQGYREASVAGTGTKLIYAFSKQLDAIASTSYENGTVFRLQLKLQDQGVG